MNSTPKTLWLEPAGPAAAPRHEMLALSSSEELAALAMHSSAFFLGRIRNLEQLRAFIRNYQSRLLLPYELPAIYRAYGHASRSEAREFLALDQELGGQPNLQSIAVASRRVGQRQLKKLLPLRDHRFVRRYSQAVESGSAFGWHTMVYGLVLAVYSIPIYDGLINYAYQTLRGAMLCAGPRLRLTHAMCEQLLREAIEWLRPGLADLLAQPIRLS